MNKAVLITGASSDIGQGLIQRIYQDYDVIIAHYSSNDVQLKSLKERIGAKLHLIQADFKSGQDRAAAFVGCRLSNGGHDCY